MTEKAIEAIDLRKTYELKGQNKKIIALNNINLSVKEGEIFGLLGPNGAGKTTLIQIFTSLISPTSGIARISGYNVLKSPTHVKSNIALMLDNKMLYNRLTAYNNLKFFCKLYKVPNYNDKIYKIVEEFGLTKWLGQYAENFSSGMKMKLALCRTLLLGRKILFLDEPTLGLDVKSIRFIVNKIKALDATVFITSHDMNVIEKMCSSIGFLNQGNLVKIGTQQDIRKFGKSLARIYVEFEEDVSIVTDDLLSTGFVNEIEKDMNGITINLKERGNYSDLLKTLSKYKVLKVKELEQSLEDLFISLS